MKALRQNPLTYRLHDYWRLKIEKELGINPTFLSTINYISSGPKKFYSKVAYDAYLGFLLSSDKEDGNLLVSILNEYEQNLDNANSILNELCSMDIHDIILPDSEIGLINFIDDRIHFNLLKVYESVFFSFLVVVAKYGRVRGKKGTDGLDLYNVIDDLKKQREFSFVDSMYFNTVRNGIAHGKIIFTEREITYIDKKGNKETLGTREIVKIFDNLIDASNGFCLALKVFLFSRTKGLIKSAIVIPKSFLIEELKTVCEIPGWRILNCFESVTIGNKRQLTIYIRNMNWDASKVKWYCFFTAYWGECLTQGYERIFISLNSDPSLPGWAAFDASKLRELRERGEENIYEYKDALEDAGIQFTPKHRFPSIIYKLGTYRNAFRIVWSLYTQKRHDNSSNRTKVRDSYFHSNGSYLVIADSSVVLKAGLTEDEAREFISANYRTIMTETFKFTKGQLSFLSLKRYLPIKYARVFIYSSDMRIRKLRYSGLIPELIATIEINVSDKIRTVGLLNCKVEEKGKYRIYWHENWRYSNNPQ